MDRTRAASSVVLIAKTIHRDHSLHLVLLSAGPVSIIMQILGQLGVFLTYRLPFSDADLESLKPFKSDSEVSFFGNASENGQENSSFFIGDADNVGETMQGSQTVYSPGTSGAPPAVVGTSVKGSISYDNPREHLWSPLKPEIRNLSGKFELQNESQEVMQEPEQCEVQGGEKQRNFRWHEEDHRKEEPAAVDLLTQPDSFFSEVDFTSCDGCHVLSQVHARTRARTPAPRCNFSGNACGMCCTCQELWAPESGESQCSHRCCERCEFHAH
jgi:hypothetical protein